MTTDELQQALDESAVCVSCPMCDTNDVGVLGILGRRAHLLCRACGWQFSRLLAS